MKKNKLRYGNVIAESYYLEKVNMGFEWFRDRKNSSILFIDLKKYEESTQ